MQWQIKNCTVMIDDDDYERLKDFKWYLSSKGYAVRAEYLGKIDGKYNTKTICMHREILNAPSGMDVDHANGNRLDNRKSNIRLATRSQNVANSVRTNRKHKLPPGICYNTSPRSKQPYQARCTKNGITYFLGNFYRLEDAVAVYRAKKKELFGEFAPCA